jgi:hypothetical protein
MPHQHFLVSQQYPIQILAQRLIVKPKAIILKVLLTLPLFDWSLDDTGCCEEALVLGSPDHIG